MTPDQEQLVIIVSATVALQVSAFAFGVPLDFTRSRKPRSPMRVKQSSDGRFNKASTDSFLRSRPRDIRPYLVHVLWADSLISKHFADALCESVEVPGRVNPTDDTSALGADEPARDNALTLVGRNGTTRKH